MLGFFRRKKRPVEVVDVTNPTLQSMLGRYFIGQTDQLTLGGQSNAWGGLFNPSDSQVNMFFDIFTITNFSKQSYTAEIWLNPGSLPGKGTLSPYVHPANLTITPPPQPKVQIRFASHVPGSPAGGANVFTRIASPDATLISDSSKGGIIIPPGGAFVIFLRSPGPFTYQARIVYSWWEEAIGSRW